MDVKHDIGKRAMDGVADSRPHREIRDEVTVHDVDMEEVASCGERGTAIVGKPREIRGEDRRRDEKGSGCET
jgi:hypothetical protein